MTTTKAITDEEVRETIQKAADGWKGKADKAQIVNSLRTAADLLDRDASWGAAEPEPAPEPEAETDPKAKKK